MQCQEDLYIILPRKPTPHKQLQSQTLLARWQASVQGWLGEGISQVDWYLVTLGVNFSPRLPDAFSLSAHTEPGTTESCRAVVGVLTHYHNTNDNIKSPLYSPMFCLLY